MTITIRTSYAGVENSKRDIRKSEKIAKQFKAVCVCVFDKGAELEISDEQGFRRAMQAANISYLIEK